MKLSMRLFWFLAGIWLVSHVIAANDEISPGQVRVAVLNFGTVNWELDVIKHHELDLQNDIELEIVPLGSKNATAVALQSEAADIIVTDWIWVARQRAEGRNFTFFPYSLAVGGVVVRPDAQINQIRDLYGQPLGIAGGAVDKSWLLLRAYTKQAFGEDILDQVEPKFAAPPLLAKLMENSELSAAINFWHYNARLKAQGMRSLVDMTELLSLLGIDDPMVLLGWVFREDWAEQNTKKIKGFLSASYQAKKRLLNSDQEWERLTKLTKAEDKATLHALRDGYRQGIPRQFDHGNIDAARKLFMLLADEGGEALVGRATTLDDKVFWGKFSIHAMDEN